MKKLTLIFLILSVPVLLFSQTLNVHKTDGTIYNVNINDIDSITFNGGTSATWTPCPGTPTVTYDGQTYNTVLIGDQCWLKENLNVGTQIIPDGGDNPQSDNGTIEKYCYDDESEFCEQLGGLYTWKEAMQIYDIDYLDCNEDHDLENVQGICPSGWHIPTRAEYETLADYVGYDCKALRAVGENDEDTNSSNFSALFTGNYSGYHYQGQSTYADGSYKFYTAAFITGAIEKNINCGEYPISMALDGSASDEVRFVKHGTDLAQAVRCIKD